MKWYVKNPWKVVGILNPNYKFEFIIFSFNLKKYRVLDQVNLISSVIIGLVLVLMYYSVVRIYRAYQNLINVKFLNIVVRFSSRKA